MKRNDKHNVVCNFTAKTKTPKQQEVFLIWIPSDGLEQSSVNIVKIPTIVVVQHPHKLLTGDDKGFKNLATSAVGGIYHPHGLRTG